MTRLLLAVLALLAAGPAHAAGTCPGFGGTQAFDALMKRLSSETSCKDAVATLYRCAWGSSADTSFSPVVVKTCERQFYSRLTPAAQRNYGQRMQMCAYRYAQQDGTMYMSAAALCQAGVAAAVAADPAKANVSLRASFDCAKARTSLERAICSDPTLGQADVILSRAYKSGLKDQKTPADKAALTESERRFLATVTATCRLTGEGPADAASVACARRAFEARFTDLDQCLDSPDCHDVQTEVAPPSTAAAARASFDCHTPRTALEIAVCDDAGLGKADIALAAAYHAALDAMGPAQRPMLVASERDWLRFVPAACPLGAVGGVPPVLGRACVRSAYETRIAQLKTCPQKPAAGRAACLGAFRVLPEGSARPRA